MKKIKLNDLYDIRRKFVAKRDAILAKDRAENKISASGDWNSIIRETVSEMGFEFRSVPEAIAVCGAVSADDFKKALKRSPDFLRELDLEDNSFQWSDETIVVDLSKVEEIRISKKVSNILAMNECGAWEDDGKDSSRLHPYNLFNDGASNGKIRVPLDLRYLDLIDSSIYNSIDIERDHPEETRPRTLKAMEDLRGKIRDLRKTLAEGQTVPVEFVDLEEVRSIDYRETLKREGDRGDNCLLCGRRVESYPACDMVHLTNEGFLTSKGERELPQGQEAVASQGFFPVGPECAKKLPAGFVKNMRGE